MSKHLTLQCRNSRARRLCWPPCPAFLGVNPFQNPALLKLINSLSSPLLSAFGFRCNMNTTMLIQASPRTKADSHQKRKTPRWQQVWICKGYLHFVLQIKQPIRPFQYKLGPVYCTRHYCTFFQISNEKHEENKTVFLTFDGTFLQICSQRSKDQLVLHSWTEAKLQELYTTK